MHDLSIKFVFYAFAIIATLSALFAISQNNPVKSVLFLVVTFFATAGIWILLSAEFLALILILVYVGAVMTLFLFVVMMLNVDFVKHRLLRYVPFALILIALLTGLFIQALPQDWLSQASENPLLALPTPPSLDFVTPAAIPSNTEELGMVLYTRYVLPFELAAILLLVAIISAITLVHRTVKRSKQQSVVDQIMTDPKDRLTLLKMKPEQ